MSTTVLYKLEEVSEDEIYLSLVEGNTSLGKSRKADIQLNDWRCDGIHALIKKNEGTGEILLIDLGSYFGTFVNKEKINTKPLKDGDVLSIGSNKIVVRNTDIDYTEAENKKLIELQKRTNSIQDEQGQQIKSLFFNKRHILEASLHWGDQLIEVQTFNKSAKITIGNPKHATFGMILDEFEEKINQVFPLGIYKHDSLRLHIPKETGGIVWAGEKPCALDTLRFYDEKHIGKQYLDLDLKIGDRCQIEIGELSLFFRFVSPAEKIPNRKVFKIDKILRNILLGIMGFYLLLFFILSLTDVEIREKTIDDIPERLKKIVYDIGVEHATEKRQAAIGQIAQTLEGGRARAEEGRSKARKSPKKVVAKKEVSKPKPKVTKPKETPPVIANTKQEATTATPQEVKVDLDSSFSITSKSDVVSKASILSKVTESGNTASALSDSGFARGKSGQGSGGGGKSVGIGSLSGNLTGGGMGAGDYGLTPSKGRQIKLPEKEEFKVMGGLDPDVIANIIKRYLPQIQHCYEQGLVKRPKLKGKVTVKFVINASGKVNVPSIFETSLRDATTESCILGKIKKWKFPSPRGGGTVGVKYPFMLMSNTGN